jgi:hypothetical protein
MEAYLRAAHADMAREADGLVDEINGSMHVTNCVKLLRRLTALAETLRPAVLAWIEARDARPEPKGGKENKAEQDA